MTFASIPALRYDPALLAEWGALLGDEGRGTACRALTARG